MTFVDNCAEKLAEKKNIKGEEYEIMRFGLAVIYINLSKTLILVLCVLLLGIFKETAILFCSFAAVRSMGFGFHSDNSVKCTIIGIIEFIGSVYIAILFPPINAPICGLIFLLCFIIFLIYAPVETKKRPISKNYKINFKVATIVITVVMFIISLLVGSNIYRNLITMGVVLESISVLPPMEKILK